MSLPSGHKLAHYEILEPIGKGGMGEVYRAKDSKLGRDVAIKVLPDEFAENEERLARFKREAKVLASLNHPGIAAIHGLEESEGTHYLVLELVPGETLAERISRGPIPVEEALEIASKIAEALEEAHEQGIVHRDLKPANIKQTEDGKIKVLDFGLAKVFQEETPDAASSMSPTLTRDATRIGVILGTAAYMSPEQAKGKRVDKRADVWAFGAVLYEMLTGQRVFAGADVSETLAFVLTKEIDWTILPKRTPSCIRQLLRRSLERDSRQRLRDMGDARIEITEVLTRPDEPVDASIGRGRAIRWGLVALIAVVAAAAVWAVIRPTPSSPAPTRRSFREDLALTERVRNGVRAHPVLSPDGTHLVYAIQVDGTTELYTRRLDELEAQPIPGTNGAYYPFFSRDGDWVGFFTSAGDQQLQKVSIRGGQPQPLCDACEAPAGGGATWGSDDTIVFSAQGPDQRRLFRLSLADAGAPQALTFVDREQGERAHLTPHILPGGDAALFTISMRSRNPNEARIAVVSLETGTYRTLIERAYNPRYVPSGHVVFVRAGELWAVPFDGDRLETTGPESLMLEGMQWDSRAAAEAPFAFSDDGLLVYVPGADVNAGAKTSLVWVDRQGLEELLPLEPARYSRPQVSPEGSRVAVAITDDAVNEDLWIYDLERESLEQLTFDPAQDWLPNWTPDGQWVVFSSARETGVMNLWRKAANFTGEAERLTRSPNDQFAHSCSSDGETVLFCGENNGLPYNLGRLSMGAERTEEYITQTEFREVIPIVSPDGNWIAYVSDETGQFEIYVSRYPNMPEGKRRISTDGNGAHAHVWGPDGSELFYRSTQAMMMVRIVETEPAFVWEGPEIVFEDTYFVNDYRYFDISRDGQRFLMLKESQSPERSSTQLVFVESWFEELKRLAPTDN